MQTRFVFAWLLIGVSLATWACDACGCSAGGVGFGYIPFQQRHIVGIHYQNNTFETVHPALFNDETDQVSLDKFNTLSIWGRYYISDKWFVSGVLPFKKNSITKNNIITRVIGLSDAQVQAYYNVVNQGNNMSDKQLNWFIGGQVYLATGKQDNKTQTTLPNLQLGTGAWGVGGLSTFSMRLYNLGFSSELTSRFNTVNSNNYRYGNEVLSNNLFFYRIKRKSVTIIPQLGLFSFNRSRDFLDAQQKTVNILSGVSQLNGVVGTSFYMANVGIRLYYHLPLSYVISNGYTKPNRTINIQLLHLLK